MKRAVIVFSICLILGVVSLTRGEPSWAQGRLLPPLKEPDWQAFSTVDCEKVSRQIKILRFLGQIYPGKEYRDENELEEAKKKVDEAYDNLDSDHNATRAAAIRELQQANDDFYIVSLIRILTNELGEDSIPYITWALTRINDQDKEFKSIFDIAFKLARTHRTEVLPGLFSILKIKNADYYLDIHSWTIPTNQCLLYTIGAFGPDICPYLIPKLSDQDLYVRRNAAFLLGYFSYYPAEPNLISLVEENDISSAGAAFALGEMKCKPAIGSIARLLESYDNDNRFWAAFSLYEMKDKAAIPYLRSAKCIESDDRVKHEIEAALQHIQSDEPLSWLNGPVITNYELYKLLDEAEENNGLDLEMEDASKIIASAGIEELPQLEKIRNEIMRVLSDKGNKELILWNEILKTIKRRLHQHGEL